MYRNCWIKNHALPIEYTSPVSFTIYPKKSFIARKLMLVVISCSLGLHTSKVLWQKELMAPFIGVYTVYC